MICEMFSGLGTCCTDPVHLLMAGYYDLSDLDRDLSDLVRDLSYLDRDISDLDRDLSDLDRDLSDLCEV